MQAYRAVHKERDRVGARDESAQRHLTIAFIARERAVYDLVRL